MYRSILIAVLSMYLVSVSQAYPIAQNERPVVGDDIKAPQASSVPHLQEDRFSVASPAIAVSAVPLPSSLSLFGAALLLAGGAGLFGRRQRIAGADDFWAAASIDAVSAFRPRETTAQTFRIEVLDRNGARSYFQGSPREAIELIADLLNADFKIERLSDHSNMTVDYEEIIEARNKEQCN